MRHYRSDERMPVDGGEGFPAASYKPRPSTKQNRSQVSSQVQGSARAMLWGRTLCLVLRKAGGGGMHDEAGADHTGPCFPICPLEFMAQHMIPPAWHISQTRPLWASHLSGTSRVEGNKGSKGEGTSCEIHHRDRNKYIFVYGNT